MSELSNISNIKNILTKYGFKFSKSMGQNFLINPHVCPKMAMQCGANKDIGVIEIGPGIGVLTCELAKLAKKVVAIELDKRLIPVLDDTLKNFNNVTIINDDILKVDLKKLILEDFNNMNVVICANLPYYITSPVIMKILEQKLSIESLTVMVQKEAADRLCALPGTRQSGAISLAVRYYSEPKLLFNVSRGSFIPSPNVDSAVIKLDILKEPSVYVNDEKLLFKVIKAAFSKRRKNIINSISSFIDISKEDLLFIIKKQNISPNLRAEQLTLEQFALIANDIYNKN